MVIGQFWEGGKVALKNRNIKSGDNSVWLNSMHRPQNMANPYNHSTGEIDAR